MRFADLHLHTVYSDGTYTPLEIIRAALKHSLSAIAIADHDNVDGIDEAFEAGSKEGVEVIPAIELSAEYENSELHILGYLIDHKSRELAQKLGFLRQNRIERIYKIAGKLKELGLDLKPESVFSLAENATVGRLHVARAMVKEKLVGSTYEAFNKYIGDKCPAYVCGFKFTPQDAINLIRSSGGIAVLAHPYTLHNDELIPQLVSYGLGGLEAYYPEHSQGMVNYYLGLAAKLNLLVTGGSDCHGNAKPEVKIGTFKVPYELVEKLKEAKRGMG
ncbi:MAG: PHP domain-containing protein [Candidatus Omnitrophica bacterium]|nr:PHP domain-containing protein [Candidatus Omnitrophota bacterium]